MARSSTTTGPGWWGAEQWGIDAFAVIQSEFGDVYLHMIRRRVCHEKLSHERQRSGTARKPTEETSNP